MFKPELLLPAGNLEKLKIAFKYGADACYVGGNVFGLRKFADNFSENELEQAINYANERGKKVYLVLNGFAHNTDIESLLRYFPFLERIQPHAFIISDMGVFNLAKRETSIPIHISTQASVTNGYTCKFLHEQGAKRIVLAREVTIAECREIQKLTDVELELFVHGAQCASYSGKCVISNYASGRDSNRGGCVQSCRHRYDIRDTSNSDEIASSHIMNAKDLMSVNLIPEFIHNRIHSFKVEGRMKSNLYVANTAAVYRAAIDDCIESLSKNEPFDPLPYEQQLMTVSNRRFSTGGLVQRPFVESIHYPTSNCTKSTELIGTIKDVIEDDGIFMEIKVPFNPGDNLIRIDENGQRFSLDTNTLFNMQNDVLDKARPNSIIKLPWQQGCKPLDVIHKEV